MLGQVSSLLHIALRGMANQKEFSVDGPLALSGRLYLIVPALGGDFP